MRRAPPLGLRGQELLEQARWSGETCSRDELKRALARAGLHPNEAWLDFEASFGGLEIVETSGARTLYGCHVALRQRALRTVTEQSGRIACTSGNLTRLVTLDRDGSIWSRQLDGSEPPRRVADSATVHVERALRLASPSCVLEVHLKGSLGRRIAKALALSGCAEASDSHATLWEDEQTLLVERADVDETLLYTASPATIRRVLESVPAGTPRRHGVHDDWS